MITIEKPNTVLTSGIKDTVSFGIKQDGLAHIFSVLRNQLYSDKILAVIREYACNAVDAHTEAGKTELPIEITLPTKWNTTFKVRDFGLGLSDEDIHDVYAFYGESTKRKSNAMIGQLGLGSKSAFAYGDNFIITTFIDGVKNTYNAFIDASQIGQIAKLASEPTSDPNGVEIAIAVKDHDVDAFHSKAFNLFRYFKVRPVVYGANFDYGSKTSILSGPDWGIYGQSTTSVAIMGNIGYPFDNHWTDDENISNSLRCGLEVNFNIGDLEISASREKLQYTDRTKKIIKDKLTTIVAEVAANLNAQFESCASLFEAHKLYGTIMQYGSNLNVLKGMVKSSLVFKGKQINGSNLHFTEPKDGNFSVRKYDHSYRSTTKIVASDVNSIGCSDATVLVYNDLGISSGITNRVYNLVNSNKDVYLLSVRTPADKDAFLVDSGLTDANFIQLSSLPKISLATATGVVKNTKHTSQEFSYDMSFNPSRKHRKLSDFWSQETLDVANDSGLYVMLDAFNYRDQQGNWKKPNDLNRIIKSLAHFGIVIPKLYGFKLKNEAIVQTNPNMVNFWDFVKTELTNYFVNNKIAQKIANRLEYDRNNHQSWLGFMLQKSADINDKTLFATAATTFEYMRHASDRTVLDTALSWQEYFSATEKPEHDLAALVKSVNDQYPLFASIRYWDNTAVQKKAIIQYINLIDG